METTQTKIDRENVISLLAERDGLRCFLGDHPFNENDEITLDHWIPQVECARRGWTYEQTWALSNLRLACKPHNARKGDLVPVDDVTVPQRPKKDNFASRAVSRAHRPEICGTCDNGRKVGYGEMCGTCGSGPQPATFPHFAKANANECDHEYFWCWACSIGIVPRKAAIITVLDGEYLDET